MNTDDRSIAVLPFSCISNKAESELFCDGITEDIINALAKIQSLKVTSRTSSFYFKDKTLPLQEIGDALNVSTILEGSVRIHGDNLRVTARLINIKEDDHFWSETWDRKLISIFETQDEISLLIADKLREHFGHFDIDETPDKPVHHNLDAYQLYLKAKTLFNKWNPEDVNAAIQLFEKAVQLEPDLIEAQVGLADGYSFLAVSGFAPREEAWAKSREHLRIAQAIDPHNAPLNYMLANEAFFTDASYEKALAYTLRSISSKPNYAEAHQFMAFLYLLEDNFTKSKEYIQYARSIDPLNPETRFYEAYYYYRSGQFEQARSLLDELLTANKNNLPALVTQAYVLLLLKEFEAYDTLIQSIPSEMMMPDEWTGLDCLRYALSGENEALQPALDALLTNASNDTSFQAHAYLFKVYAYQGKNDKAFAVLEKLFTNKSSILLLAFGDPVAAPIREDIRFKTHYDRIFKVGPDPAATKKNTSTPDEETAQEMMDKLQQYMEADSPFLNPALTLRDLAARIHVHPNHLSWLINEKTGKNFNTYINQFRTEHFKKLAVDPKNGHISLIGLAYESGFNSKTVFNTFFKKETGMTPNAYVKQHQD